MKLWNLTKSLLLILTRPTSKITDRTPTQSSYNASNQPPAATGRSNNQISLPIRPTNPYNSPYIGETLEDQLYCIVNHLENILGIIGDRTADQIRERVEQTNEQSSGRLTREEREQTRGTGQTLIGQALNSLILAIHVSAVNRDNNQDSDEDESVADESVTDNNRETFSPQPSPYSATSPHYSPTSPAYSDIPSRAESQLSEQEDDEITKGK